MTQHSPAEATCFLRACVRVCVESSAVALPSQDFAFVPGSAELPNMCVADTWQHTREVFRCFSNPQDEPVQRL